MDSLAASKMCKHEQTGSENFVMKLEGILDRMLRPKKADRKSNVKKKMMGSEHGK
jgi:hypothetical protein